jgi:hypothetical protein
LAALQELPRLYSTLNSLRIMIWSTLVGAAAEICAQALLLLQTELLYDSEIFICSSSETIWHAAVLLDLGQTTPAQIFVITSHRRF